MALSKEQQEQLTPSLALKELKEGHQRFIDGTLLTLSTSSLINQTAKAQFIHGSPNVRDSEPTSRRTFPFRIMELASRLIPRDHLRRRGLRAKGHDARARVYE